MGCLDVAFKGLMIYGLLFGIAEVFNLLGVISFDDERCSFDLMTSFIRLSSYIFYDLLVLTVSRS